MFGLFRKKEKEACSIEAKGEGASCSTEAKGGNGACNDTKVAEKPKKEMKDDCCGGGCH